MKNTKEKLFVLDEGGFGDACVGTLEEVLEWAGDNSVGLDNLYVVGERVDVVALIKEKYSD